MWWGEVIILEVEGANLDLGREVDDAKVVYDGATHATTKRCIREQHMPFRKFGFMSLMIDPYNSYFCFRKKIKDCIDLSRKT